MDKTVRASDPAIRAEGNSAVAFLTPVVKAAFSDLGFESAVLAQQVLGGHGYMSEWGMEQLVRDARIAQIYEGTNGVQALDLVSRKLTIQGGELPAHFFPLVRGTVETGKSVPAADEFVILLASALNRLERLTCWLVGRTEQDAAEAGAASVEYLRFVALIALGWMWLRMALLALGRGSDAGPRHTEKLAMARFFFARVLPQALALEAAVLAGSSTLMALPTEQL